MLPWVGAVEMTAHAHRERQLENLRHSAGGRGAGAGEPGADPGASGEKEAALGTVRINAKNAQVRGPFGIEVDLRDVC